MPKSANRRYYAVRIGREGTRIYDSWLEAKPNVFRLSGASFKSFESRAEAEQWLEPVLTSAQTPYYEPNSRRDASQGPVARPKTEKQAENLVSLDPPISPPVDLEPEVPLSREQQAVLDAVKTGKSIFFTGAAGTGKSVLLRAIIRWCRSAAQKKTAVTASTGIASVNVGGVTLHSWAGIGLGKEDAERLVGKIFGQDAQMRKREMERCKGLGIPFNDSWEKYGKNNSVVERWRSVQVLVIDEISMVNGQLFDKLEYIARKVRTKDSPFGGIQLVLSGDFCQLPPVPDKNSVIPPSFAFDSATWSSCVGSPFSLKEVFRQEEQSFIKMLNAMRFGILDSTMIKTFKGLSRDVMYDDGLEPTELFATRNEVDTANITRLSDIKAEAHEYKAGDFPGYDESGEPISRAAMDLLLKDLVVQKHVVLKVGAQVMLIKNLIQGSLVNGSIGLVVGFCTARNALKRRAILGIADASGTVKKSASEILEAYESRYDAQEIRSRRRLGIYWRIPDDVRLHINSSKVWPMVRFGDTDVLCVEARFEGINALGQIRAWRVQVPLILAWALSIHKSQGQTLERVRVNMTRIFEKGQAYVALSRATSLERLQVLGFDPAKVRCHPRVLEWMRRHNCISEEIVAKIEDTFEFGGR